jgi:tRNA-specific 2-thiouridylase
MPLNKTVVIAMSGGVDSSVAALLLKEQGYNCIGITLKLWDCELAARNINRENDLRQLDSANDAKMICAKIGIPHYILNFNRQFQKHVIDNFINEYIAGRTPNPCVQCNIKIKWEALIEKSLEFGADFIATGHYARTHYNDKLKRYELLRGVDPKKDQSYALWGLSQENLARTIFPLGGLTKAQARDIAKKRGLHAADKSESMEICFIPDNNYKRFLNNAVSGLENKFSNGNLIGVNGEKLGKHSGYPFFTIGQRRGIGKGFGKPMYVIETHPSKNEVVIGEEKYLYSKELTAKTVNFISIADAKSGVRALVKIRYNDSGSMAAVYSIAKDKIRVVFDEPKKAVTPGQSVIFYDNDKLLGGGIIESFKK